jgi:hypothetical protein
LAKRLVLVELLCYVSGDATAADETLDDFALLLRELFEFLSQKFPGSILAGYRHR